MENTEQERHSWLKLSIILFFFFTPIIGLITWLLRRISNKRNHSIKMRFIFLGLWVIGLFSFNMLIFSISREFTHQYYQPAQAHNLLYPAAKTLTIYRDNNRNMSGSKNEFRLNYFLLLQEELV